MTYDEYSDHSMFRKNVMDHTKLYERDISDGIALYWLLSILIPLLVILWIQNIFLSIIGGLLGTGLFILFHDMSHEAFFSRRYIQWNRIYPFLMLIMGTIGLCLGIYTDNLRIGCIIAMLCSIQMIINRDTYLTLNQIVSILLSPMIKTDPSSWRTSHNAHHANVNNLDQPPYYQTANLAYIDYKSVNWMYRCVYNILHCKYVLFLLLPITNFLFIERIKSSIQRNIDICIYYLYLFLIGGYNLVIYEIIVIFWSSMFGAFLFHIQHTFDNVHKYRSITTPHTDKWDHFDAGIYGSSYFVLPWYLRIFSCGIQYHHIHHLNPRVPCYKLEECHKHGDKYNYWKDVRKVYICDIFKTMDYKLYDEENKSFIS